MNSMENWLRVVRNASEDEERVDWRAAQYSGDDPTVVTIASFVSEDSSMSSEGSDATEELEDDEEMEEGGVTQIRTDISPRLFRINREPIVNYNMQNQERNATNEEEGAEVETNLETQAVHPIVASNLQVLLLWNIFVAGMKTLTQGVSLAMMANTPEGGQAFVIQEVLEFAKKAEVLGDDAKERFKKGIADLFGMTNVTGRNITLPGEENPRNLEVSPSHHTVIVNHTATMEQSEIGELLLLLGKSLLKLSKGLQHLKNKLEEWMDEEYKDWMKEEDKLIGDPKNKHVAKVTAPIQRLLSQMEYVFTVHNRTVIGVYRDLQTHSNFLVRDPAEVYPPIHLLGGNLEEEILDGLEELLQESEGDDEADAQEHIQEEEQVNQEEQQQQQQQMQQMQQQEQEQQQQQQGHREETEEEREAREDQEAFDAAIAASRRSIRQNRHGRN